MWDEERGKGRTRSPRIKEFLGNGFDGTAKANRKGRTGWPGTGMSGRFEGSIEPSAPPAGKGEVTYESQSQKIATRQLSKSSNHYSLSPFFDDEKHFNRVGGRPENSLYIIDKNFQFSFRRSGPFYIKDALRQLQKFFVAIFICLSTKAVQMEPVMFLTKENSLAALKRFTAGRGMPEKIYSDTIQQPSLEARENLNLDKSWKEGNFSISKLLAAETL